MKGRLVARAFLPVLLLAAAATTVVPTSSDVKFTDITSAAGIKFTHNSGRAGKKEGGCSGGSRTSTFPGAALPTAPGLALVALDAGGLRA